VSLRMDHASHIHPVKMNSTRELCLDAIEKATAEGRFAWNYHGLDDNDTGFSVFWCYEQTRTDVRGRPMLSVKDSVRVNQEKMLKRSLSGKILRKSKNVNPENKDALVTYTNHLTYHVKLRSLGIELPNYPFTHVSHRCHNMACIRQQHLLVESNEINQQRKGCPGFLLCEICKRIWKLCKHDDESTKCCLSFHLFVCCQTMHEIPPHALHKFL
jgi:hypothetical protein